MEVNFYLDRFWKNWERSYEPLTNHKIIKNVFIESKNSGERFNLMIDLLTQMEERLSPFSALYINLNPKVECPEVFDAKYTYGSLEFNVPYIHDLEDDSRDRFSKCFNAIFNFHPELQIIMDIIYSNCTRSRFPTSIIGFLGLMYTYLEDKPYDNEFTTSLKKNIKDALDLLKNDNVLERTLRIGTKIPDWVSLWRKNQKIWIDLSSCRPRIQKMLIPVIFLSLLRSTDYYGSRENYWRLNGVVIINDADKVFRPVPWKQYLARYNRRRNHWNYVREQNLFLTKEQMDEAYGDLFFLFKSQLETYYHALLRDEFRFRNITLFTGTSEEKVIHNFISSLSQVRIVQGKNNNFDL